MYTGLCASRVADRMLLLNPACVPNQTSNSLIQLAQNRWELIERQVRREMEWDAKHRSMFLRNYCNTDGGWYWVYRTRSGKTVCISRWHRGIGYASAVRPPSCSQAEAAAEIEAADAAGRLADVPGCVRPDQYGVYYYAI